MVYGLVVLFGWIALPLFVLAIARRGLTGPIMPTMALDLPPRLFNRSVALVSSQAMTEVAPHAARGPAEV